MSSRIHTDPKADHYLVWGEQSKTFAQKYQGIDKSKINLIGYARFNNYFQKRNELVKSYFKFNYALFMEGFGIQEDLNFFFTKIDYEIGKLKNFKLIYRPHPWRKNQKNIDLENFKNIILDPQLEYFYKKKMSHTSIQPDLNYYPSLIKNSSFIIAAPSTMVIESTIFYKPIVLLAYDEKSKFGNYSYLKNIEHFNGIEKFPNVIICKNINNLNQIFKRILNMRTFNKKNIDFLRNYYLYNNNIDFPTRLEIFIKKIIIKKNGIRTFNI